ncbi:hypothetical protein AXG93_1085s1010 [Marchantia polymorpha subsp. ruderalis]|uniref:Uncharacterized protein n=1 Tax=Marchantia polymorpha subsp. ruderalis TaxID=1480154 RepID=A0A176VZ86_MARPO|nr:hypothetical protein AXG93_1085s1010 [Marchantia polymorpha subsp. ruderalis]
MAEGLRCYPLASPTLAYVFALSEKIELNIVEEKVVTSSFARDTTTTPRVPRARYSLDPLVVVWVGIAERRHQTDARDTGACALVPSFAEVVVVMLHEAEVAEVIEVPVQLDAL